MTIRTAYIVGEAHGTDDPKSLSVGRAFQINWLFGDTDLATHYVYEIYERWSQDPQYAAPHPVYVGVTGSFAGRWSAHKRASWWFERVIPYAVLLSGYRTRHEARLAEAALIGAHRPAYNTKPEKRHQALANPQEALAAEVFMAELGPMEVTHGLVQGRRQTPLAP